MAKHAQGHPPGHAVRKSRLETLAFLSAIVAVLVIAAVVGTMRYRAIGAAPGPEPYASPSGSPYVAPPAGVQAPGSVLNLDPPDPWLGVGVLVPGATSEPTPTIDPTAASADASAAQAADGIDDPELAEAIRQHEAWRRKLAQRAEAAVRASQPLPAYAFRVASFNVLGASHTVPGGSHKGYVDGVARMSMTVDALRSRGVDIVGFQEMEQPQFEAFSRLAPEYTAYPGMLAGNKSVRFNLAWRTSMWEVISADLIDVPYAGGNVIGMPVVLLQSRETGRLVWFANFHNPADTPSLGNNGHWREVGSTIELDHLTALRQESNYPVIVTGDFNDRAGIFCKFTSGILSQAAAGGSNDGTCLPPDRMQVDWIFGTSDVSFSGYVVDGDAPIAAASDHEMVHSTVTLLEKPAGLE